MPPLHTSQRFGERIKQAVYYAERAAKQASLRRYDPQYLTGGIPFYNDSGETIPAYACMRHSGTQDLDGTPVLTMAKPNSTFQRLYYVNSANEVESGKYGGCYTLTSDTQLWHPVLIFPSHISGVSLGDTFGPTVSQWYLKTARYGFKFLYEPDADDPASGSALYLRQEPPMLIKGILDGDLDAASTASMSVYDSRTPASASDTGQDVTVHDDFLRTSTTVPSGTTIAAQWLTTRWLAMPWGCAS